MKHPIGAVIGHHFSHEPGWMTKGGAIIKKPDHRPAPTEAELAQWDREYDAFLQAEADEPDQIEVLEAVLEDKGLVSKAERDAKRQAIRDSKRGV